MQACFGKSISKSIPYPTWVKAIKKTNVARHKRVWKKYSRNIILSFRKMKKKSYLEGNDWKDKQAAAFLTAKDHGIKDEN